MYRSLFVISFLNFPKRPSGITFYCTALYLVSFTQAFANVLNFQVAAINCYGSLMIKRRSFRKIIPSQGYFSLSMMLFTFGEVSGVCCTCKQPNDDIGLRNCIPRNIVQITLSLWYLPFGMKNISSMIYSVFFSLFSLKMTNIMILCS